MIADYILLDMFEGAQAPVAQPSAAGGGVPTVRFVPKRPKQSRTFERPPLEIAVVATESAVSLAAAVFAVDASASVVGSAEVSAEVATIDTTAEVRR